ncbi:1-deoxy-D-xylulose-5-phosphate reductoisomerase [uncultured Desulfovibrio sp.]|uniref:1-deoxy-D-xylulose-5-phosphate reductoisomerase n=1 Tax=uncultured Desulfovibrio sp. TaxID=167968 RepID=UPI00260CFBA7|nr:1-deoxy-D-xylulose-5-phosphate reductoisomerase [uncultured Desulfovibrio sp.]
MAEHWPGRGGPAIDYISGPPSERWRHETPRGLVILGATGSIGCNALAVVEARPDFFRVLGLACARNVTHLATQAERHRPPFLAVLDEAAAAGLAALLPTGYRPRILTGREGYTQLAALPEASTVLSAQVGAAGLAGTLAAVLSGKVVCLANKESLVLAGGLARDICARTGAVVLPVDSEHNAIFQCLAGRGQEVAALVLTASGGPFRGKNAAELRQVTVEQALMHPNWSMGAKISIDSATLMNKGLEVAEAFQLYGVPSERIRVLVHPQSVVHSMVELADGSLLAQMGTADMRMSIAHCLLWPHCAPVGVPPLDLVAAGPLSFHEPDLEAFPCLDLARTALARRGGLCVVMNAANETAVELFLRGHCAFADIPRLIGAALEAHEATAPGRSPLCPPLTTPADTDDPLALEREVHILVERIERLDHHIRALVRELARG